MDRLILFVTRAFLTLRFDDYEAAMEWRVVPEFPEYEVNEIAQIRRKKEFRHSRSPEICKTYFCNYGYPSLRITSGGKSCIKRLHVLVCSAFHGPRPSEKHEVAHWDGNRANARADNLRWATRKENFSDMVRHGTRAFGQTHHCAKLTEENVQEIKRMLRLGMTSTQISRVVGHSRQGINNIKSGRQWSHVQ